MAGPFVLLAQAEAVQREMLRLQQESTGWWLFSAVLFVAAVCCMWPILFGNGDRRPLKTWERFIVFPILVVAVFASGIYSQQVALHWSSEVALRENCTTMAETVTVSSCDVESVLSISGDVFIAQKCSTLTVEEYPDKTFIVRGAAWEPGTQVQLVKFIKDGTWVRSMVTDSL